MAIERSQSRRSTATHQAPKAAVNCSQNEREKSGYSPGMIEHFSPDLVIISERYGKGETDPRFRTCTNGAYIDGELTKFVTTKTKKRQVIVITEIGVIIFHEAD